MKIITTTRAVGGYKPTKLRVTASSIYIYMCVCTGMCRVYVIEYASARVQPTGQ